MRIRLSAASLWLIVPVTVLAIAGCSKSGGDKTTQGVETTTDGQTSTNVNVQGSTDRQGQAGGTNVQVSTGSNADGTAGSSDVNVNAPLVGVKVDRSDGALHINAPFVHINRAGYGQATQVDVDR